MNAMPCLQPFQGCCKTTESHAFHSAEVPGWLLEFYGSPPVVLRPAVTHPVTCKVFVGAPNGKKKECFLNAFIQHRSRN